MVRSRPMRRASHAAPTCEAALAARAAKNSRPSWASLAPKRSWKNSASSAPVRKPPPRLSRANSADRPAMRRRLSGASFRRGAGGTSIAADSRT